MTHHKNFAKNTLKKVYEKNVTGKIIAREQIKSVTNIVSCIVLKKEAILSKKQEPEQ